MQKSLAIIILSHAHAKYNGKMEFSHNNDGPLTSGFVRIRRLEALDITGRRGGTHDRLHGWPPLDAIKLLLTVSELIENVLCDLGEPGRC